MRYSHIQPSSIPWPSQAFQDAQVASKVSGPSDLSQSLFTVDFELGFACGPINRGLIPHPGTKDIS